MKKFAKLFVEDEIDENIGSYQNIAYLASVVWKPENVNAPDDDDEEKTHTSTSEVPVPYSWLNAYPELMSEYSGDYETAANSLAANGINKVWECYVAGLDPTDENAKFISIITFNENSPIITCAENCTCAKKCYAAKMCRLYKNVKE